MPSPRVAIPPGQTSFSFDVTVNGDTTVEADETFAVHVTGASGALVVDGNAVGTIVNDDEPPPVATRWSSAGCTAAAATAGATLTHEFIELFNRGTRTVGPAAGRCSTTSATGAGTWQVTPLAGSIPPGGYYLIQEAAGYGRVYHAAAA